MQGKSSVTSQCKYYRFTNNFTLKTSQDNATFKIKVRQIFDKKNFLNHDLLRPCLN